MEAHSSFNETIYANNAHHSKNWMIHTSQARRKAIVSGQNPQEIHILPTKFSSKLFENHDPVHTIGEIFTVQVPVIGPSAIASIDFALHKFSNVQKITVYANPDCEDLTSLIQNKGEFPILYRLLQEVMGEMNPEEIPPKMLSWAVSQRTVLKIKNLFQVSYPHIKIEDKYVKHVNFVPPIGNILTCPDSRIPSFQFGVNEETKEITQGSVCCIATAGNGLSPENEETIKLLKGKNWMVIGHRCCGAVTGTLLNARGYEGVTEAIHESLHDIPTDAKKVENLEEMSKHHILKTKEKIERIFTDVKVNGAFFDIEVQKLIPLIKQETKRVS